MTTACMRGTETGTGIGHRGAYRFQVGNQRRHVNNGEGPPRPRLANELDGQ